MSPAFAPTCLSLRRHLLLLTFIYGFVLLFCALSLLPIHLPHFYTPPSLEHALRCWRYHLTERQRCQLALQLRLPLTAAPHLSMDCSGGQRRYSLSSLLLFPPGAAGALASRLRRGGARADGGFGVTAGVHRWALFGLCCVFASLPTSLLFATSWKMRDSVYSSRWFGCFIVSNAAGHCNAPCPNSRR